MRYFVCILIVSFLSVFIVDAKTLKEEIGNSTYKRELVLKLAEAGKQYDLSRTLIAIAKIESNFGQVKVNLQDPSCGVLMIHLKYYMKNENIDDTPFKRNLVCQRLIDDDSLSISEAIALLQYAKNRFCGKWGCTKDQWMKVWAYYNAGNAYNSPKGRAYAEKVRKYINQYFK